jgi:DNA (cytosine-5)-methyltransferase 3A
VALHRAGIKVDNYYASEIDKYAIQVTQNNYPETIQLGDVTKVKYENGWLYCENNKYQVGKIDLLIGGSPCQGFSLAGKQLNFNDPRSKLFFEYNRILKEVQPKYFLLENVKMKQKYQDIISKYLGIVPIEINSALVSAQNRVRLYWTNVPNIQQPSDKGIALSDVLENSVYTNPGAVRGRKLNKGVIVGRRLDSNGHRQDYDKSVPISQCLEVRKTNVNKSNCLTTVEKDNVLTPMPVGRYPDAFKNELPFRYYTRIEYCRLQTLPDNYTNAISESQAKKCIGNGWTVDVIAHIFKNIEIHKSIDLTA